ncbi:autotransporter outer membrane beta-barrel domain-containing protein [Variovorax sp. ZT5P49]
MSGGSVLSTGPIGLWVQQSGKGLAQLQMTGGTVTASGTNGDGIFAASSGGTFAVDVSGGTVTGGDSFGAAIHTSAAAGGTVNIGAGAVINAGASGVAIRDGDANRDGTDETGGNVAITTAGRINGSIVLGTGTDTVTVTGGTINGNITGDGVDALNFNLGANSFIHGAPYTISGMDSIVMNSGNAQLNGSVAANTLNVKGGTLVLGGSAAIVGMTSVEGGTLAVNGTLNGSVNVLALGRLQGSGTVGSTTVAGIIAPGNSIGTLSINGNFAQSSGSTYQVEVDPASSASDLIRVSGTASIGSGSNLQVVRTGSAAYGLGTRYTVLSADGGITGTYSLTGDIQSAFVRLADSYDANHVYLTAEKVRGFVEAGGTPNQVAVGAALDTMPNNNSLVTAMAWLPNDFAARDALNQLSADIHASSKTAALEDSRFVREAAIDRLRSAACAPGSVKPMPMPMPQQSQAECTPEDSQARAGWAQVFGSWGHIDSDGNAAKLKRDIGGFMAGFDTGIGGGWRVGALGGYSRASADTSSNNSSSKTDSYHLGIYGGTQWGATALRLGASQSWNKNDTNRSVAFAGFAGNMASKYDSTTSQVFGEVGQRIDLGSTTLEPFAGLAHVRLRSDAFLEQGGAAALYGFGGSIETTFSTIGLRAGMQLSDSTRLRGVLGWRHAFGDTAPKSTLAFAGSLPFTLAGVPLAKNVAVLEAGMETQLRPNLSLNASYSGQFGDGLQDHGLKVSLNWSF